MADEMMEKEFEEYITFEITASDGRKVELAVVDEFEFDKKNYVVGALVEGDEIQSDSLFIYRSAFTGDELTPEKITDAKEYEKVCAAYLEMDND